MWGYDAPPPVCGAMIHNLQYVGLTHYHPPPSSWEAVSWVFPSCPLYLCMCSSFTVYQTFIGAMNEKIKRQLAISNPFVFRHIYNLKVHTVQGPPQHPPPHKQLCSHHFLTHAYTLHSRQLVFTSIHLTYIAHTSTYGQRYRSYSYVCTGSCISLVRT